MKSSCNCKAERCQSIRHPSYNILNLKRENLNFFSQDSKNHLTCQKLRKFVSFSHLKHKINDFAAKLIRIVSFNASDEIKGGRHGCIFSVVKRLLSGKALNTCFTFARMIITPTGVLICLQVHLTTSHIIKSTWYHNDPVRDWDPGVVPCKNVLQSLQMLLVLGNDSKVPCFVLKAVFSKVTQQCLLFLPCLPFAFTFFFSLYF